MSDTEREMLEWAAKAAGIPGAWNDNAKTFYIAEHLRGSEDEAQSAREKLGLAHGRIWWDPRFDDGDALRLAVQLSLEVSFVGEDEDGGDSQACVGYAESAELPCRIRYLFEVHNGDIFAATRRAIFRAAAEIGKAMP